MSQEKVDRYKEQKKNRKAILAKKKRNAFLTKCGCGLVVVLLAAWLGYQQWIPIMPRQTARLYMQM